MLKPTDVNMQPPPTKEQKAQIREAVKAYNADLASGLLPAEAAENWHARGAHN